MIRLLILIIFLAQPATAKTGEVLLGTCKASEAANELAAGFCLGTVASFFQVMDGGNSINGMTACFPSSIGIGEVIDAVVERLENSPALLEFNIASAVPIALMLEFPCE